MPDYYSNVSTLTVTNGGTSELMLAENQLRNALFVQPQSEACVIQFGGTAGLQASGVLTFAGNPANGETIAINGVTFTFVTGASTATNVHIGASKDLTAVELAAVLNASVNASISIATYTAVGDTVTISYDTGGADGNAFTLADSSAAAVTRSAATLTGGSNAVGGIYLAQYQIADLKATDYPAIRKDVYIVSATTGSKIGYMFGGQ